MRPDELRPDFYDRTYFDGAGKSGYRGGYTRAAMDARLVPLAEYTMGAFAPRRVLDIGCAKGFLVAAYRERGVEAYGVDFSEYALAEAPPGVRPFLSRADLLADRLPFDDGFMDGVTILDVLEHLPDASNALSEAARVLRAGGFLLATTPEEHGVDLSHVNVRPRGFWMDEMARRGLRLADEVRLKRELVDRAMRSGPRSRAGRLLFSAPGGRVVRRFLLERTHGRPWKWMVFVKEGGTA